MTDDFQLPAPPTTADPTPDAWSTADATTRQTMMADDLADAVLADGVRHATPDDTIAATMKELSRTIDWLLEVTLTGHAVDATPEERRIADATYDAANVLLDLWK